MGGALARAAQERSVPIVSEPRDLALARLYRALDAATVSLLDNEAPDEVIELSADRAEEFAAKLTRDVRGRALWGYVSSRSGDVRGSLVLGLGKHGMAPGRESAVGDHFAGVVRFDASFEGPGGAVHGGYIAWLFDEACAAAQAIGTTTVGRTAELNVKYVSPTPLLRVLDVRAEVSRLQGGRVFVHADLRDGGRLCAEADATFAQIRPGARADSETATLPGKGGCFVARPEGGRPCE